MTTEPYLMPTDLEECAVFGDWLQAYGDPYWVRVGELVVLAISGHLQEFSNPPTMREMDALIGFRYSATYRRKCRLRREAIQANMGNKRREGPWMIHPETTRGGTVRPERTLQLVHYRLSKTKVERVLPPTGYLADEISSRQMRLGF